ncbi:MAG: zinc ribbon domain-containing protein [Nitrososphaerales archaeon]
MKVFNGKMAAEQYMSAHTLAYSTPDMTLKKFAYWLGDLIDVDCNLEKDKCANEDGLHPKHRVPRLMVFIETKDIPFTPDEEDLDETAHKPSGAISAFYNVKKLRPETEGASSTSDTRFCMECGAKIRPSKFCPQCGTQQ